MGLWRTISQAEAIFGPFFGETATCRRSDQQIMLIGRRKFTQNQLDDCAADHSPLVKALMVSA